MKGRAAHQILLVTGIGQCRTADPVDGGDWRQVLLIIGDYEQCAFSRERPFFYENRFRHLAVCLGDVTPPGVRQLLE